MKKTHTILIVLTLILSLNFSCNTSDNQSENIDTIDSTTSNINSEKSSYDSLKAQEYGADAYGMKKYVIAFLKKGPNRDMDSTKAADLQTAHMENIQRMAVEGKLVLAGPFFGEDDLRGIYVFNVETIEEAEELTKTDPAIQAGSLVMELKEWYGSAALMGINDLHNTLVKKDITDE